MFLPTQITNNESREINLGDNVRLEWKYNGNSVRSLLTTAHKIAKTESSLVIFNFFPTSLGKNRVRNFIWSLIPLYLRFYGKRVLMIFHNSVTTTSDWKSLGYSKIMDLISARLYTMIERSLFRATCSVFLLESYKSFIRSKLGLNVLAAPFKYIDSLTALLASGNSNLDLIEIAAISDIKTIHIHGNFGPQKDLEFALCILSQIAEHGFKFQLYITGSINSHFPEYKEKFEQLIKRYNSIINEVIIPIPEANIFEVFKLTDILLLPYRASGGRSGVMDLGAFFDLDVIVFNRMEYVEQASWYNNIYLINPEDLEKTLLKLLGEPSRKKIINVDKKLQDSLNLMLSLLKRCIANGKRNE